MTPWCGREPRRWQREALDAVLGALRSGTRRPLVHGCTGAGKSLLLAELAGLAKGRVLVTTPTQALVEQLATTMAERCPGEVGHAYQHRWEPDRRIVVTCNASLAELLGEQPEWDVWLGDEAHRLEGDVLRATRPASRVAVGLTATPYRADDRGLEAWDRLVYSYTSADAVADGVLVPWRVVRWDGTGEPDTDQLCARWVEQAEGPGIVSALTVDDAERVADLLPCAAPIHGRLPRPQQRELIEQLRTGGLRCLVHVQLLTEGIDLPWLRWIMLRRPVASPVRLVQEVGRVLRAAPGKTEAVIYDPHDLMGSLGLVHAAALEDAQRRGVPEQQEAWEIPELDGLGDIARVPPPVAVDHLSGWATDLLGVLRAAGLAEPPQVGEGRWRQRRATDRQRQALERLAWAARYLPDDRHRRAVRWMIDQDEVRAGTASDLIDVLRALATASAPDREQRRHWRLPVAVPNVVEVFA